MMYLAGLQFLCLLSLKMGTSMNNFDKLLTIAKRKFVFDQTNSWYAGSNTYLSSIKEEISEVIEEIPKGRLCYLEDELGDILWNYLNIVLALEKESGLCVDSVIQRAALKYDERVGVIESGGNWQDVKERQKRALAQELDLASTRSDLKNS